MAPGADGQGLLEQRFFDPAVLLQSSNHPATDAPQSGPHEAAPPNLGHDEYAHEAPPQNPPSAYTNFLNGQIAQQPAAPQLPNAMAEANKLTDLVMQHTMGAFLEAQQKAKKATEKRREVIAKQLHGHPNGKAPVKAKGAGTQAE